MSSPSPSIAVQRPDLGATMEEFDLQASRAGFIGMMLFPVVEVAEQSANIGRIPLEQLLSDVDTRRASGGGYSRDNFTFDEFSYATRENGWEVPVDDRLTKIYRRYFDAEVVATQRAVDRVLRNLEKRILAKVTNTANITQNAAASALWSNHAAATPIDDVQKGLVQVRSTTGFVPNTVSLDWEAYMHARECAQVVDRLKYAGYDDPKKISEQALAQVFKVDKVIVSGGQRNGANPNQPASLSALFDKTKVLVAYTATDSDVEKPSLGRTFHWSADGSSIGTVIETYRDESKRSDIVRARQDSDEKLIYGECGYLVTGVL